MKENNQFSSTGAPPTGEVGNLLSALNTENFRGSLKEAYSGKSMSLPLHSSLRKLHSADSALIRQSSRNMGSNDNEDEDDDQGFSTEELKIME